MEKNKQVLEFGDIIMEVNPFMDYTILRNMFLEFVEWTGVPWKTYVNTKTKKEILEDFKYFSIYYYLPF
jgi:hypothetical protein